MNPEYDPAGFPRVVERELPMLHACLRLQEQRRRGLMWEIAGVQMWQRTQPDSVLARWVSSSTVQRRQEELKAINHSIFRLRANIEALLNRFPQSKTLLPDSHPHESTCATVSHALLQHPNPRRQR